ncbi:MAG: hypothetical protein ACI944_002729 [Natronomonas sp.]|mgnify:FL=1|jgi:hypothetical protein
MSHAKTAKAVSEERNGFLSINNSILGGMSTEHTAYIETLAHVNCGECDGYWGLSDITKADLSGTEWSCPHCGHSQPIGEFVES